MGTRNFFNELSVAQRHAKLFAGQVTTDGGGDVSSVTGRGFTAARTGTGEYTITFLETFVDVIFGIAVGATGRWTKTGDSTTTLVFTRYGDGADVSSTGTITCDQASAVATTDEVTIDGVSYASVSSSADPTAGEWELGASDADMATNLAAAINGHTSGAAVTAEADGAVVTVTADAIGEAGNLAWSETGNGMTLDPTSALAGGYNAPDAAENLVSGTFEFFTFVTSQEN